jgi:UDP-N-acetylmuramate dehydrogenase
VVHRAREKGYAGLEGLAGIPGSMGGAIKGNSGSFGYEIGSVVESVTVINRQGELSNLNREILDPRYRSAAVPGGCIILSANLRLPKDDVDEVAKRMGRFLEEKRRKQPVSVWSAGSVFKNPEGTYAGMLIDNAGCKGMRRGDIEVSGLHANFFVNTGKGKASDFLALMEDVKERVSRAFGIELEPEIKIIGRSFAYDNR